MQKREIKDGNRSYCDHGDETGLKRSGTGKIEKNGGVEKTAARIGSTALQRYTIRHKFPDIIL